MHTFSESLKTGQDKVTQLWVYQQQGNLESKQNEPEGGQEDKDEG